MARIPAPIVWTCGKCKQDHRQDDAVCGWCGQYRWPLPAHPGYPEVEPDKACPYCGARLFNVHHVMECPNHGPILVPSDL